MRKVLTKKTQPRKKTSSTRKRATKREIEPAAHVVERKTKKRPAKSSTAGKATSVKTKPSKKRTSQSPVSSRKAKTVGRAVGKVIGRALGTVERALTRVMPKTAKRKK